MSVEQKDDASGYTVTIVLGSAKSAADVARLLSDTAVAALATKINVLEKMDNVLGWLTLPVEVGKGAAQLYPPLQAVIPIVSEAFKKLKEIPTLHKELTLIMDDVAFVLPSVKLALSHVKDPNVKKVIDKYLELVRSMSEDIIRNHSLSVPEFLRRSLFKSRLIDAVELKQRLASLRDTIQLGVITDNVVVMSDIRQHQLSETDERILQQLKPPKLSSYDSARCCLPGTRKAVIDDIVRWSTSPDTSERLFWLHGIAGCGKSSVAASVASRLKDQHIFSFFCKRDDPKRKATVRVIRALIYFIARAFPTFSTALLRVLQNDSTLIDEPRSNQFKALLVDRLEEVSNSTPPHPIVIVLDALDECEENEIVSRYLAKVAELAPWIRLIVTSRPLPGIQGELQSIGRWTKPYDLFGESAEGDILVYTRHRFKEDRHLSVLLKEVTPGEVEELARKALGLFIWVSVVCSYISQLNVGRAGIFRKLLRSEIVLESEERLDELYLEILNHASGSAGIRQNKEVVRLIVGLVRATSKTKPLPAETLFAFRPSTYLGSLDEWRESMRDLGSVLISDLQTNAIRGCHKSFLDFLDDQKRSRDFWTEPDELNGIMAKKCFEIMLSQLKFNICELETSYLANSEVKDLKINQHIPEELQYSCLYWLDHLSECERGIASREATREMLRKLFCQARPLYWLEVLSLLSELRTGITILENIMGILKDYGDEEDLYAFAIDLFRFMKAFYEPMSASTPHIYISALLWAPSECIIGKLAGPTFNSQACVLEGRHKSWPANIQTLQAHGQVLCVAYSPDGRHIVSGSSDKTIRVWDAKSGALVGQPLLGHEYAVWSLMYSPDGSHIVSGSVDKTIRVWDAKSGALVGQPLLGHEGVLSVTYSPDGSHIVSGSSDKTIRFWDAQSSSGNESVRSWDVRNDPQDCSSFQEGYCVDEGCFILSKPSGSIVRSDIPLSSPEDAWIRTVDGGLLLWVPHAHRSGIRDQSLLTLPWNALGHRVRIDWKKLCHGNAWSAVKVGA